MKKSITCIGSGLGTLTAAAILAQKGHKVSVYEKFSQVGGYATLFKRKGFTFDVSLHQIGGVHSGNMHKILKATGVYDRLTYLKHPYLTQHVNAKGEVFAIPNGDPEAIRALFIEKFPDEERTINRWFKVMKQYGDQAIRYAHRTKSFVHQAIIDLFAPLLIPRILSGVIGKKRLSQTIQTENRELLKLLTHFSLYYGLPMDEINEIFPMMANYGYYFHGGYYIQGGGHELAKKLVAVIEECGGEVACNSEVTGISTSGNKATAITINDKKEIPVEQLIMSGSPAQLYGRLLPKEQQCITELKRIDAMECSITASVLYVGLDCSIGELNSQLAEAYEFSYESPFDEVELYELFQNCNDFSGTYDDWPFSFSIHSNIDSSCLPPSGGSCFDVFIPDNYKRWDSLSPEQYNAQKKIEVEKLLDKIEEKVPNIREHIVVCELGTPKTMERYTGNPQGALYGYSQKVEHSMFNRVKSQSSINNIAFASAWTQPGGGYEGAMESGFLLANPPQKLGFVLLVFIVLLIVIIPLLF